MKSFREGFFSCLRIAIAFLPASAGCEYPPDCPVNEDDKYFVSPATPMWESPSDADCLPTETIVSCNSSWCTGVSEAGNYCVDLEDVNNWADEQGYVMFHFNEDDRSVIGPRCDSTPD